MSKNSIIGLVIIVGLLIGYSVWMTPSKEEMAAARRKADSITQVQRNDSLENAMAEMISKANSDSLNKANPVEPTSVAADSITEGFSVISREAEKFYILESDLMKLKISSKGGRIWSVQLKDYQTFDTLPLILFKGDSTVFGFEFNTEDLRTLNTGNLLFFPVVTPDKDSIRVSGKDSVQFAMRVYPGNSDPATRQRFSNL